MSGNDVLSQTPSTTSYVNKAISYTLGVSANRLWLPPQLGRRKGWCTFFTSRVLGSSSLIGRDNNVSLLWHLSWGLALQCWLRKLSSRLGESRWSFYSSHWVVQFHDASCPLRTWPSPPPCNSLRIVIRKTYLITISLVKDSCPMTTSRFSDSCLLLLWSQLLPYHLIHRPLS